MTAQPTAGFFCFFVFILADFVLSALPALFCLLLLYLVSRFCFTDERVQSLLWVTLLLPELEP